jgi:hypothetical protein
MSKFLKILPGSMSTPSVGPFLLDPNAVTQMISTADNTIIFRMNHFATGIDELTITFNGNDTTRQAQRLFMETVCSAAKSSGISTELPSMVSGSTGNTLTIDSITFS